MAQKMAAALNGLSPADRAKAAIFANNFGAAAAIDFYGALGPSKGGLPPPEQLASESREGAGGDVLLVLGSDGKGDREHFASVEPAGRSRRAQRRR
jgi:hypothetical protein